MDPCFGQVFADRIVLRQGADHDGIEAGIVNDVVIGVHGPGQQAIRAGNGTPGCIRPVGFLGGTGVVGRPAPGHRIKLVDGVVPVKAVRIGTKHQERAALGVIGDSGMGLASPTGLVRL